MIRRFAAGQIARRALQLSVFAFVIYSAMGGAWRNYKVAHNHRRLVTLMEGEFWGTLYGLNEDVLSWLELEQARHKLRSLVLHAYLAFSESW